MAEEVSTQPLNLPFLANEENTAGKTFIVTGASTGLGFEAAQHLVHLGAKEVILSVRTEARGDEAKAKIEEATGMKGVAKVWELDLCSYTSVKAFVKRAEQLERIDAVIENAAIATADPTMMEGHRHTLTVNVLSTFLLAILLLPKLNESAEKYGTLPHLSIVTSGVGFDARQVWDMVKEDPITRVDELPLEKLMVTYPISKLMITQAVRQLAAELPLEEGKVVINAVCPGLCKTELVRHADPVQKQQIVDQQNLYGRTAEDGSRTLLAGALAGKESHGGFMSSCEVRNDKVRDWVTDEEGQKWQKHLWNQILKEIEIAAPGSVQKALQN
ncbi:uncharacterized protein BDV14DRAFT_211673 [Aspergillus stella-maris]|uniref:uncharacterized protein n=1 Tax=Aspergillus stella-maris TaxID=1810926 RepID=UPI003CCE2494